MQAHHVWSAYTTIFWAPTPGRNGLHGIYLHGLLPTSSNADHWRRLHLADIGAIKVGFSANIRYTGDVCR